MTDAERLRAAAQRLRDMRAEVDRAHPGVWTCEPNGNGHNVIIRSPERPGASRVATTTWAADAAYIALMANLGPGLADWLDREAARPSAFFPAPDVKSPSALALADLILGGA